MTQNTAITSKLDNNQEVINRKIDLATAGLHYFIYKDLSRKVSAENALKVSEYILSMKNETNVSDSYREITIKELCSLSKFVCNKQFLSISREDILRYLDNLRKSETSDPFHKWIGTYNLRRILLLRFFKWLYYPEEEPKRRTIPAVMVTVSTLVQVSLDLTRPLLSYQNLKPSESWDLLVHTRNEELYRLSLLLPARYDFY
jgi:hypothetical protein